jgi:hypothetical protein
MSTTVTEPWFVAEQRERKALTLADACRSAGLDADAVAHLDSKGRREVERAAGTRPGSDTTWTLVVSLLAGSAAAPCPWCVHGGDPAGTPGPPMEYGHSGPCRT